MDIEMNYESKTRTDDAITPHVESNVKYHMVTCQTVTGNFTVAMPDRILACQEMWERVAESGARYRQFVGSYLSLLFNEVYAHARMSASERNEYEADLTDRFIEIGGTRRKDTPITTILVRVFTGVEPHGAHRYSTVLRAALDLGCEPQTFLRWFEAQEGGIEGICAAAAKVNRQVRTRRMASEDIGLNRTQDSGRVEDHKEPDESPHLLGCLQSDVRPKENSDRSTQYSTSMAEQEPTLGDQFPDGLGTKSNSSSEEKVARALEALAQQQMLVRLDWRDRPRPQSEFVVWLARYTESGEAVLQVLADNELDVDHLLALVAERIPINWAGRERDIPGRDVVA